MRNVKWEAGCVSRRLVVKELVSTQKAKMILLQETELKGVTDKVVIEIGGMRNVKWEAGCVSRRLVVKELVSTQKAKMILLQETELKGVTDKVVIEIGGMRNVKWEAVVAAGAVGGPWFKIMAVTVT
eukprot:TRINITY_DN29449_c1_g1_i1.p1 TRINITY_DN29449_c1_g1~~TRINITY_DN29449_c1_g1_i1.p1  ORF type:complete len:127 (+),score=23.26 TRINITY_DN29449_c1_g1_i1:1-381(+)